MILKVLADLAGKLAIMHENHYLHNDIKGTNVLLVPNKFATEFIVSSKSIVYMGNYLKLLALMGDIETKSENLPFNSNNKKHHSK